MRKPRSYAEIYNDRWDTVVNVFRVLRDEAKAARLKTLIELTPFSRAEFESSYDLDADDVENARRTILRSFAGFGSASTNREYVTGFRANSHRSGTTPASDWVNYPSHIAEFVARLRGVCIENKDAHSLIPQHDDLRTLFFVDPPYPHSTRNMNRGNAAYAYEMTDEDHRRLSEVLRSVAGMVMICGYDCELYRKLYADWHVERCETYADGAKPRVECVWMNTAAVQARKDVRNSIFDGMV